MLLARPFRREEVAAAAAVDREAAVVADRLRRRDAALEANIIFLL